ncbi:MAG: divergent polysaccharide deacetylase family protein [Alphaproteobacteria bacterium]|jgi:hypothetical protein
MEPRAVDADPGPNALLTSLPEGELDRRIAVNLGRLNGYVGVNNYMGSRFTASARDIRRVMVALRARDLLFLDGLTTGRSTGHGLAWEFGIPTRGARYLSLHRPGTCLDPLPTGPHGGARPRPWLCHSHRPSYPEILDAPESWLPRPAAQGLVLVPVSAPTLPATLPAVSTRKVGDTSGPAVRSGAVGRKSRSKIGLAPSRRATP